MLLKGILMGLDETFPKSHNLVTLSEKAGLPLSEDDRSVLSALTVYTRWYSRYPAAKSSREMIEGLATLDGQYPRSGNLGTMVNNARCSPKAVNKASYERLYSFFNQKFFDVHSSVYESAEFSFDLPTS